MKTDKPTKEVLLEGGPQDGRTTNVLLTTRALYVQTQASTGLSHKYEDAGDDMTFEYKGQVKEGL